MATTRTRFRRFDPRLRTPILATIATLLATACRGVNPGAATPAPVRLPFAVDTMRATVVAPGVIHRFIYSSTGPWGIHVLDVDLTRCYSMVAAKNGPGAAGRVTTSALLDSLRKRREVIGGVNADFFSLATGVPTGALISGGRVITGPAAQPVLAADSGGRVQALRLNGTGVAIVGSARFTVGAWNRPLATGLALYDAAWGRTTDTLSGAIEVVLGARGQTRVIAVDTLRAGVAIPATGVVIVIGQTAPAALRAAFRALKAGDVVETQVSLTPIHPLEAVGGRPMLARDSVVVPEVDTEGQASFIARNPRTAAGIANRGRRLLLVVIDGRQAPYSDGMTLRETANLMLALGARDAINLDGGGSSAMVYADPSSGGAFRVANTPSDLSGGRHVERTVGDAVAIVRGCAR